MASRRVLKLLLASIKCVSGIGSFLCVVCSEREKWMGAPMRKEKANWGRGKDGNAGERKGWKKRLVVCVFKFGFIKPGMSEPTAAVQYQGMEQSVADICICRHQGDGLVLTCQGPNCPYHNKIHPKCFGMTDDDIQKALSSP